MDRTLKAHILPPAGILLLASAGCIPRLPGPDQNLLSLFTPQKATSQVVPGLLATDRLIYVTAGIHSGDFANDSVLAGSNWVEKADNYCSLPSNQPAALAGTGNYRAILSGSLYRKGDAGSQANWPIQGGLSYYASDGTTLIATADTNNILSTISNVFPSGGNYWTGIANSIGWTTGAQCSNWSDGTLSVTGYYGLGSSASGTFIAFNTITCDIPGQLLCVQDMKDMGNGTVSSAHQKLRWMKCTIGQTWDSATNSCTGAAIPLRYCSLLDDSCNGASPSGSLDGGGVSDIYSACTAVALTGRTWRVPTLTELAEFRRAYSGDTSLFPGTVTAYYWTANSMSSTQAFGVYSTSPTTGALNKNSSSGYLRCVSTGL